MNWSEIYPGIFTLLGVFVGGVTTFLTQKITLDKQLKSEKEKEKEERNIERLKVYSEILKLDGENEMQAYEQRFGGTALNIKTYQEKFRPVFFSKFYLIDIEVAESVREMDNVIGIANFFANLESSQNDELIRLYNQIIFDIEKHLKSYK